MQFPTDRPVLDGHSTHTALFFGPEPIECPAMLSPVAMIGEAELGREPAASWINQINESDMPSSQVMAAQPPTQRLWRALPSGLMRARGDASGFPYRNQGR